MKRRTFLETLAVAGAWRALGGDIHGVAHATETGALPSDPTDLSAVQLSDAIRSRTVTCREVMQAYLARIDRYNPVYNAIVNLRDGDTLLAEAEAADRELDDGHYRGWMHGMPHAAKDLTDVQGMVTTSGYAGFADRVASADSALVAKIRQAGAIFIGKTNVPEFGLGSQSYNPIFGATGSAWNPEMTAGGSSGGAASALGTHMVPVADGSDMMGSLRNPGAFNNVVGFRPSMGRISSGGKGDLFYRQLPASGPMGRDVRDVVELLATMAGADPATPLSLRDSLPAPGAYRARSLDGLKIGWMADYDGYLATEPGILDLCETSLKALEQHGARIEPCKPDYDMARLWQCWLTLRHWRLGGLLPLYENPDSRALLKPEVVWEVEGSLDLTGADIRRAGAARSDWFRALRALFDSYDLLVLPTAQVFPFPKTVHWPDEVAGRKMDTYHRWMEVVIGASLAGIPSLNLPVGFNDAGLPMGMQVMGPFARDADVLQFGLAYEANTDFLRQRPELLARQ